MPWGVNAQHVKGNGHATASCITMPQMTLAIGQLAAAAHPKLVVLLHVSTQGRGGSRGGFGSTTQKEAWVTLMNFLSSCLKLPLHIPQW